jgi:hypothetical protein
MMEAQKVSETYFQSTDFDETWYLEGLLSIITLRECHVLTLLSPSLLPAWLHVVLYNYILTLEREVLSKNKKSTKY